MIFVGTIQSKDSIVYLSVRSYKTVNSVPIARNFDKIFKTKYVDFYHDIEY